MQMDETNPDDFEQEAAIEVDPDETEAEEGDDEAEIEYAEIELNGKKYQVPAELKDGYMMQADYTRKTQMTAEDKKAVEAEKASVEALREATDEELNARATLLSINQRLDEYRKLGPNDWNAWEDEDPFAAQRGFREFQTLQQQAGQAVSYLQDADKRRSETAQQETAKRIQETREFAEKEIKGWSPEVDAKIVDFATKDLGISKEILAREINPIVYKTLHLAWIGQQSIQKQTAAKPSPTVQNLKPLAKVSPKGGAPARKSLDEMNMDEYAAYMNKRDAAAARR